jgi:hypothetical protein
VMEQIQAVYDAGFSEWILWNHSGQYSMYENVSDSLSSQSAGLDGVVEPHANSLISSENSAGSSSGTPAVNSA